MEAAVNRYDQLAYPGYPYTQTHPNRLATLAHLYGMSPAPIEQCRVLELGCGDGANLMPMALQLRASDFLGIDLATSAIHTGRQQISELGLVNIRLEKGDLMEFSAIGGQFDYIIAHGLYSWVPRVVQDKILDIVQSCLAPQGVAYISYNTLPGGYLPMMLREMMQYHVRGMEKPEQQLEQALSLIQFLASVQTKPDGYSALLRQEWERLSRRVPHAVFHDELGECTAPLYLHQFISRAADHRLQFLSEASFPEMQPRNFHPGAGELLQELGDDIISREQYLDFLKGRRFRQTLLCHDSVRIERDIPLDRVTSLMMASMAQPSSPLWQPTLESPVQFCGPHNSSITTAHPLIKAALLRLGENWPLPSSFAELWDMAHARLLALGSTQAFDTLEDRVALAKTFFLCYGAGVVDFHCWAPNLTLKPGDHPLSSPLARLQARQGNLVTTLFHTSVEISGGLEKKLLQLLDGTRDRSMILLALEQAVISHEITLPDNREVARDPGKVRGFLAAGLEIQLDRLARLGLLLA